MTTEVSLGGLAFSCLSNPDSVDKLNRHFRLHQDFMPHQIAAAAGCNLSEAFQLLLALYHFGYVEARLVIYDKSDPEIPSEIRKLTDGLPQLPYLNPNTEELVISYQGLAVDFLFLISQDHDDLQFLTR